MKAVSQVSFDYRRIKIIRNDGAPVLCLSLGDWRPYFVLQRPVIHPLYSPLGLPLTEQGAHNRPHHRGVWVGHGRVNGVNFFQEGPGTGWVVPVRTDVSEEPDAVRVTLDSEWRDPRGTVIARETRVHAVRQVGLGYILDIVSNLCPIDQPLRLEPDRHGYMGVRVIDALDEDDGGRILSSDGAEGESAVSWDKSGGAVRWVDYAGQIAGLSCGISAILHPSQSPMAVAARSYGMVFLNPTPKDPLEFPVGHRFKFGARFFAHDGQAASKELDALWQDFGRTNLVLD